MAFVFTDKAKIGRREGEWAQKTPIISEQLQLFSSTYRKYYILYCGL